MTTKTKTLLKKWFIIFAVAILFMTAAFVSEETFRGHTLMPLSWMCLLSAIILLDRYFHFREFIT